MWGVQSRILKNASTRLNPTRKSVSRQSLSLTVPKLGRKDVRTLNPSWLRQTRPASLMSNTFSRNYHSSIIVRYPFPLNDVF
jgi:hypothetical protein